jgi:hypothetical protein
VTHVELLALIDAGAGRWEIRRTDTGVSAGSLWKTIDGFELLDADDHFVGTFTAISHAMRGVQLDLSA